MFRISSDEFLAHPFQASVFITTVIIAPFLPTLRPPLLLSALLAYLLVRVSMFFGARFARKHTGSSRTGPEDSLLFSEDLRR